MTNRELDNMKTTPVPVQKLWTAVLSQAISDLSYKNPFNPTEQYTIRQNTRAWFMKDKNEVPHTIYSHESRWDGKGCDSEIASFEWICEVLGLRANTIREMVLDENNSGQVAKSLPQHQVRDCAV